MVASPDHRGTRPLFHLPTTRATRPLEMVSETDREIVGADLSHPGDGGNVHTAECTQLHPQGAINRPLRSTRQLTPYTAVTKPPGNSTGGTKHYLVIPAATKRVKTDKLVRPRPRRLVAFTGLVLCLLVIVIT